MKTETQPRAVEQLKFLLQEVKAVVGQKPWRWFTIWFGGTIWVNVSYRLDRFLYLLFGRVYPLMRPAFFPFFLLFTIIGGRHEIHYGARIGPGLKLLHAALGTVISQRAIVGERLTLTGGNLIGGRRRLEDGDLVIGSRVYLGAHAVVLGPVKIGDGAKVGAGAVVISDVAAGTTVVGVPAKELKKHPAPKSSDADSNDDG